MCGWEVGGNCILEVITNTCIEGGRYQLHALIKTMCVWVGFDMLAVINNMCAIIKLANLEAQME